MGSMGLVLLVVAVGLHALLEIRADPSIDRRFVVRTGAAAGVFLLYVTGGTVALLGLLGRSTPGPAADPGSAGVAALLFLLGWVAWGTVLLVRTVPRRREPPGWLMRVGWVDLGLLLVTVGAGAALLLGA